MSLVNTAADSPYCESLTASTACSSPSTSITAIAGPKTSSRQIDICCVTPAITVGST